MEEKSTSITPFRRGREKWRMWSGKFLERPGRLGYDIILGITVETPEYNKEEKTKEDVILKKLNKNV